jgi:alpha-beta hydrolase superfamily lysophospholipase
MDAAYDSANNLDVKALILYGENDELIPKKATYDFLERFLSKSGPNKTVAFYREGYHMLLRDVQAVIAWKDIEAWIKLQNNALPSGADRRAHEVLQEKSKNKDS